MILDNLHWSILRELQENARSSFADIGRKVGLSAPAVAERVQRLEDEGIIKRYGVHLDLEKIGYPLRAIISFRVHSAKLDMFLKFSSQLPEVYECHRVTGDNCLMVKVAVKRPADLEALIRKFAEYGETTTSVILSSPVEFRVFNE